MVRKARKKPARDEEDAVAVPDAVVIPADSREIVQTLKEIVDCSEQEIYKTLVSCRRDPNEAINRLLSQAQEVKSIGGKKEEVTQTEDTSGSCSQEVDSTIQNGEFSNGDECDGNKLNSDGNEMHKTYLDGNKLNSDETSNVQGTCNHLAGSYTTAGILGPYKSDLTNDETKIVPTSSAEALPSISMPSSSDLVNDESKIVPTSSAEALPSISVPSSSDLANDDTKIVPITSAEAVPSIYVPSSSDFTYVQTKRVPKSSRKASRPHTRLISATPDQRTMADVVKMSLGLSKESATEAPLKDDCPLHEKSDVPDPIFNSLNEPAATKDQLQESTSVSNQDLCGDDVTSVSNQDLCGDDVTSVSNQDLRDDDVTSGSNQDLRDDDVNNPFSKSVIDSATKSDQLQESASGSNQDLRDDDVSNPFSNSYTATRDQLQESVWNQNLRDNDHLYFSKSFIENAAIRDQLQESASVSNQKLCDDDVTKPFSNSFVQSAAGRNQLWESASVSNQHLHNDYGGSRSLCDEDNNKNDELDRIKDLPASAATCVQQLSVEMDEPKTSVKDEEPNHQQVETSELPLMIFGRFGSGQPSSFPSQSLNDDSEEPKASVKVDEFSHQLVKALELPHLKFGRFGSGQPSSFPAQSLNDDSEDTPDFADDLSLKDLITRDDEPYEEEEEPQRRNVANEQMTEQVRYETHGSAQENQYRSSSSATGFTFDNGLRLNPALATSEPSLQMQNFNPFPDVMHQQADRREPDSPLSYFPFNQPMPTTDSIITASSLHRMTEALKPATVFEPQNHHYSQPEVPLAHYNNMMNPRYSLLNQNDSNNNMSPSAFQQHGGSYNSTYRHHESLASMLPLYRNSNLPQLLGPPSVPSAYGLGDNNDTYHHQYLASMPPQYRNSSLSQLALPLVPYGSGTSIDNAVDWRYDNGNHLPPIEHQSANSNIWSPQRRDNSRVHLESKFQSFFSALQNQQLRSFRDTQPQEQLYRGVEERRDPYFLSRNQEEPRSESSKQWLWREDKY